MTIFLQCQSEQSRRFVTQFHLAMSFIIQPTAYMTRLTNKAANTPPTPCSLCLCVSVSVSLSHHPLSLK